MTNSLSNSTIILGLVCCTLLYVPTLSKWCEDGEADMMIIVDASINGTSFQKQIDLFKSVVQHLPLISSSYKEWGRIRIGLVSYSCFSNAILRSRQGTDSKTLILALDRIKGETSIDNDCAVNVQHSIVNTALNGMDSSKLRMLVLTVLGPVLSSEKNNWILGANLFSARSEGVRIFVLSNETTKNSLKSYSSKPHRHYMSTIDNFSSLKTIYHLLTVEVIFTSDLIDKHHLHNIEKISQRLCKTQCRAKYIKDHLNSYLKSEIRPSSGQTIIFYITDRISHSLKEIGKIVKKRSKVTLVCVTLKARIKRKLRHICGVNHLYLPNLRVGHFHKHLEREKCLTHY
ncbi:DgyrCDS11571 [Dimorphilus gyrociliatus]|uniref:DgyrCDS11571 n=1 Tax=Dimorphilus gyrociliatus TaxID=2664684 RepID=A0A7I8W4P2_9ANNE|nr:DgyrCDS11571 [Dimorphilus gyrociliatus]